MPCPSNILSTVTELVFAIKSDVLQALRLAAVCFMRAGPVGCACAIAGMLEPHWRKVTTDPNERCEGVDPVKAIMGKMMMWAVKPTEDILNTIFVNPLRRIDILGYKPFGFLQPICWDLPPYAPDRSKWTPCGNYGKDEFGNTLACEDEANGLENLCYYERVRRICLSPEDKDEYDSLFDIGYQSADELERQYAAAFGSSYDAMDPTLSNLFSAVEDDDRNYDYEKDICSGVRLHHEMSLDMLIQSCIFALMDGICSSQDTEDLETFLASIEWKLPDVRFDYDVSPPPPPPSKGTLYDFLLEQDPEGIEAMREKMESWCVCLRVCDDCAKAALAATEWCVPSPSCAHARACLCRYPELELVATTSAGSSIGPYGPEAAMTPHQLTKAFLATRGLSQDGLAARMIASKFTNRWRYGALCTLNMHPSLLPLSFLLPSHPPSPPLRLNVCSMCRTHEVYGRPLKRRSRKRGGRPGGGSRAVQWLPLEVRSKPARLLDAVVQDLPRPRHASGRAVRTAPALPGYVSGRLFVSHSRADGVLEVSRLVR
jgi:hypothetical protein